MLDELAHLRPRRLTRGRLGETLLEAFLGEAAQVRGRRLAGRHDLLGIFVAQLVEREAAASGDDDRLGKPGRRIEPFERGEGAQMALAVGMERVTGLRD